MHSHSHDSDTHAQGGNSISSGNSGPSLQGDIHDSSDSISKSKLKPAATATAAAVAVGGPTSQVPTVVAVPIEV